MDRPLGYISQINLVWDAVERHSSLGAELGLTFGRAAREGDLAHA